MYYYFGVNMDNLEVVEYDVSNEVYDWILSQLDYKPELKRQFEEFVQKQKQEKIIKNATVDSVGC